MKKIFTILIFLSLGIPLAYAGLETKKVTPPRQIEYDNKILTYNPAWADRETYLEANLDNDPDKEVIISFAAFYRPPTDVVSDKGPVPFSPPKKEIVMVENYAFYQIYKLGPDGHYQLAKTINGMDQLGKVVFLTIDAKSPPALAFLSPGGERYTDLSVYQWKEGGYRLIFNQGSSQPIEISQNTIHIGPQTFSWDLQKNTFIRNNKDL